MLLSNPRRHERGPLEGEIRRAPHVQASGNQRWRLSFVGVMPVSLAVSRLRSLLGYLRRWKPGKRVTNGAIHHLRSSRANAARRAIAGAQWAGRVRCGIPRVRGDFPSSAKSGPLRFSSQCVDGSQVSPNDLPFVELTLHLLASAQSHAVSFLRAER